MQQDYDSSASGYLTDAFEGISRRFTDVEILTTSEVNVVAKAKRYGRWWLLKGLQSEVASKKGYQQRLRKELEILMILQSPSVVTAYGLEEVEGLGLCIVMEYVDGKTLGEWLESNPKQRQRKRIARELIEATGYVHSKGVVHRDLKPSNIIIAGNGQTLKLIDFGLADTDSHAVLKQPAGTRKYMSPEQEVGTCPDIRNDIYSLGIIFQEMRLSGCNTIINRCLLPIDQRYKTTSDLLHDLNRRLAMRTLMGIIVGIVAIILMGSLAIWSISEKTDAMVSDLGDSVRETRQVQKVQQNDIEEVGKRVTDVVQHQNRQEERHQQIEHAIRRGKQYIDRCVTQTHIGQHLDTLSNVIYLRPDFGAVIQNSGSWVKTYMQNLIAEYSPEEKTEIEEALNEYVGKITEAWGKRFIKLKEDYDATFMQGD